MRALRFARSFAFGLGLSAGLVGCPSQPALDNDCVYDPAVGNCFDVDSEFVFDDARIDASNTAALGLPAVDGACRDPVRGYIQRVSDGDTVEFAVDGGEVETVRFIGVDTPETYVDSGPPHCFGPEAKLFTEELAGHRAVLTFDRDCNDDYDRTLAYVWLGPLQNDLWQRQLVRRGFARQLTVAPNDAYADIIAADVATAQAEGVGLWSECVIPTVDGGM